MSAPGRPKCELLPLGGKARSAKGAPSAAKERIAIDGALLDCSHTGRRSSLEIMDAAVQLQPTHLSRTTLYIGK